MCEIFQDDKFRDLICVREGRNFILSSILTKEIQ